ncbi:Oidioi.mRNA.OKI2018_I69.XSR.g14580.t1.cds [Oikopleura dioica]|uniref:Oidioi.mRNA.OKI2018_I69.XSR.g14580.t1.cds n=1 Tax=Oikopleura dioica TaxID=34765 RepID=A0ABN7SGJ4_OIKDI|nr:Oidioi.mRNA.OKI2018_I69.XSR.g14580.t1.cds [Oikopleura dioica]
MSKPQSKTEPKEEFKEDEFEVEKILNQRTYQGQLQYLIRWRGYDAEDDTWEPVENLDCPGIIKAWEDSKKSEEAMLAKARKERESDPKWQNRKKRGAEGKLTDMVDLTKKKGFERGLVPERIIGAATINEKGENGKKASTDAELVFLIKWENSETADIVSAKEAKAKCPHLVFQFYEERILWENRKNKVVLEEEKQEAGTSY